MSLVCIELAHQAKESMDGSSVVVMDGKHMHSVYASPRSDQARSMKQAQYLKPLKSILKKPRDRRLAFPSLPNLIGTDCRRVGVAKD
ncbi:hypothetical protein Nepgr_002842 [Nepenthes gracilis]|uniref:Uncharacterized protein n=1 Tax=Nepenthes gracilis TaxID=150966 RepID=A0AAD3P7R1_NEPGR|nr:hypothetical protein Nepgr_002842 [Nepenthes gracilis]